MGLLEHSDDCKVTEFWCNESHFTIWTFPGSTIFSSCFESTVIVLPAFVILALVSALYCFDFYSSNYRTRPITRTPFFQSVIQCRVVVTVLFLLCNVIQGLVFCFFHGWHRSVAWYVARCTLALGCSVHVVYLLLLQTGIALSSRGPSLMITAWMWTYVSTMIQIRSVVVANKTTTPQDLAVLVAAYLDGILQSVYLSTLFYSSRGRREAANRPIGERLLTVNIDATEQTSLLQSGSYTGSYTVPPESLSSPVWSDLGVALDRINCLSKLTFSWINPMLQKGAQQLLLVPEHLYELPHTLRTNFVDTKFWLLYKDLQLRATSKKYEHAVHCDDAVLPEVHKENVSLFRALVRCFGVEYFSLGVLKFLADSFSFAGPLLLNYLLQFLENENKDSSLWIGYCLAGGLFLATIMTTFLTTQFHFYMNNVGLKIRAAIITTIYRKSLVVSVGTMRSLSTGEIINFMSTDTDRIQNFCPSFHQIWSLPLQILVCLGLLWMQVGLAFLAGLAFIIILVPVNRCLANKIAKLSVSMMESKDKRVKLMNEIICGIQVIKFYAWEKHFAKWVNEHRKKELSALKARKYLDAACVYFWATTPVMFSFLIFVCYIYFPHDEKLTASKIFTCIALVNILITPLNAFPWVINGLVESWVSLRRVQNLLSLPEINYSQYYSKENDPEDECQLVIKDASFTPKIHDGKNDADVADRETFVLESVNLKVHQGQLIGVIGKVGSGKSTFLHALLAEIFKTKGEVIFSEFMDGIGYVSQEPWIQQGTIRSNILFGRDFDSGFYHEVVEACSLIEDFDSMPRGDETEVGERGITLSGGQKARISLARAVYQNKALYCLDDPLSAVDAKVAKHIFHECILGLLKKATCILCTHQIKFLQHADLVIVIDDGRIVQCGHPSEIIHSSKVAKYLSEMPPAESPDASPVKKTNDRKRLHEENLIEDEQTAKGSLNFHVYKSYWLAVGPILGFFILMMIFLMQGTKNFIDGWLAHWTSMQADDTSHNSSTLFVSLGNESISSKSTNTNTTFFIVYGSLVAGNSCFSFLRAFLFAFGGVLAAKNIHKKLLRNILKAPVSFFEKNPLGRIVNRFSSDLYAVDDSLPFMLNIFLAQTFGLFGTFVVICYSLPWLIFLIIPLFTMYTIIQNYYRHTSRELKRLSAVSLSPIYSHFSETLSGLTTIRAFKMEARFKKENKEFLERNQKVLFSIQSVGQWLNFRLQMIGVVLVTAIALLALVEPTQAGLLGLALSYALSITNLLSGAIWSFTETEKEMVNTERVLQYTEEIDSECWNGIIEPPPHWPSAGYVQFKHVYMKYKEHHPYALCNLNFTIKPGEKVGIVGRTGAGKSSLFKVLFRLVKIDEGEIYIDGINVYHLDLLSLRSKIAIIPQNPFLFSGTIRNNLDPDHRHSNEEIHYTLEQCHLLDAVDKAGGLDSEMVENGSDFSAGQKQLFCLARALLTNAKILCIDEATANVDYETDALIQKTIRTSFHSQTILTIAHRIETVVDCDRVMVMSAGKIKEFAPTEQLLANKRSLFHRMVGHDANSGEDV